MNRKTAFCPCQHATPTSRHHHSSLRSRKFPRTCHQALPLSDLLPSTNILSDATVTTSSTPTAAAATTTFEPVLNIPALGSFVLIMTVFALLRFRVNAIEQAANARTAALVKLREIKSNELAQKATTEQVKAAVTVYERALIEEKKLRTIVPGIRLRAPNSPQRSEGDRQAVRQFLNQQNLLDDDDNDDDESVQDDPPSSVPTVALGTLLAFIFGSQIMLFVFLSMDDATVNQVMTEWSATTSNAGSDATSTVAEQVGDLVSLE